MHTVIITSGNSGLVRKTAEKIAKKQGVYRNPACRNMSKAKQTKNPKKEGAQS